MAAQRFMDTFKTAVKSPFEQRVMPHFPNRTDIRLSLFVRGKTPEQSKQTQSRVFHRCVPGALIKMYELKSNGKKVNSQWVFSFSLNQI